MVRSALTRDTVEPRAPRVFAFVDTNVLLHYRFFRDVDWAEELGADEATLVFAPVVVEELDEQKWAGTRRARARAKKVLRTLKGLGLSATPGRMRPGVQIFALDEEPSDTLFVHHRLQPRISDDRLLASVLAFAASQTSDAVIKVLTADMGLSLKGATRQIAVVSPDERLRRDDEPDDTERELKTARRELAVLRAAAPKPKLTLAGEEVLECQVRRFGDFGTETLGHLLEVWRSKHPYVAAIPDSIARFLEESRIPLVGLTGLPGFWSKQDAARHNAEIDRVSQGIRGVPPAVAGMRERGHVLYRIPVRARERQERRQLTTSTSWFQHGQTANGFGNCQRYPNHPQCPSRAIRWTSGP